MEHQSEPVADYLAVVARELDFHPALSRRVCGEVGDHLWQAVEDRGGRSVENQLQAILNFGEARELARGYVAASLLSQIRYVCAGLLVAATVIFLAMKARVAWYGWLGWKPHADFMAVRVIALPIDHYTTIFAIVAALMSCLYIATRRAPARVDKSYLEQLNRGVVLCGTSAGALLLCVGTEVVLTGVQLSGVQWCVATVVPVLSIVVEITAVIGLVFLINASVRGRARAASLLRD